MIATQTFPNLKLQVSHPVFPDETGIKPAELDAGSCQVDVKAVRKEPGTRTPANCVERSGRAGLAKPGAGFWVAMLSMPSILISLSYEGKGDLALNRNRPYLSATACWLCWRG